MTRTYTFFALLFFILLSPTLLAQANDECSGATVIADPSNFCSAAPEDNTNASPSPEAFPSCWSNAGADLWYTFTAVASDLIVTVKGQTPSFPAGTLSGPQIAVYSGTCGNLAEISCVFDQNFLNNLPIIVMGLVPGQQYFIRIDGILPGVFEYCIQNKDVNVISNSTGDCPTATMIFNKNPLLVEGTTNGGLNPTEMDNPPCLPPGSTGIETSSAWFVFTACNNGRLEFTITPLAPEDDIDFIVYRLPNGPGNCMGKFSERCMAAGDFTPASPCMGPTGLNSTSTDINQTLGCNPGMDNFIRFLTLVPGATYALAVNNYTTSGNGYTIEWGGTAVFEGGDITASFMTDEPDKRICLGEELVLTDSSYASSGNLTDWSWDFGTGSVSDSTNGQGPHTVQYQTIGPKTIILTVKTGDGCAARDTAFLLVEFCCTLEAEVSVEPGCPEPNDPAATATVAVQNALEPLTITWSNGQTGSSDTTSFDDSGAYMVLVVDANGCKDSVSFLVNTPLNVSAMFPPDDTILQGETVTLAITAMPTDSLSVTWTDNDGNVLTGTSITISPEETVHYNVVVNNTGCVFSDSVSVVVEKPKYERPNAFTPNGDGTNDAFAPVLVGHTLVQLEVWSRWGEKVFDSINEGKNAWDGTINGETAPSDVYVYRMRVRLVSGEEKVDKGDVTLLR